MIILSQLNHDLVAHNGSREKVGYVATGDLFCVVSLLHTTLKSAKISILVSRHHKTETHTNSTASNTVITHHNYYLNVHDH